MSRVSRDVWNTGTLSSAAGVLLFAVLHGVYAAILEATSTLSLSSPRRLIVVFVAPVIVAPGVVWIVRTAAGRRTPWRMDSLIPVLNTYVTLVGAVLLVTVSTLLFVVPGLVAAVLLLYAVPAAVLDARQPVEAMVHSARTVRDTFWRSIRTALIAVLGVGIGLLAAGIVFAGGGRLGASEIVVLLVGNFVAGVALGVTLYGLTRRYVVLRESETAEPKTRRSNGTVSKATDVDEPVRNR